MKTAAANLRSFGPETVIPTAGVQGTYLVEAAGESHFPAFTPGRVVNTMAAGDAFVGGFAKTH